MELDMSAIEAFAEKLDDYKRRVDALGELETELKDKYMDVQFLCCENVPAGEKLAHREGLRQTIGSLRCEFERAIEIACDLQAEQLQFESGFLAENTLAEYFEKVSRILAELKKWLQMLDDLLYETQKEIEAARCMSASCSWEEPLMHQASEPWFNVEAPRGYAPSDACREIELPGSVTEPRMAPTSAPPPMPCASRTQAASAAQKTEVFSPPISGRKPGLGERIKKLFQKTDTVGFSALAPAKFRRGAYTMVDVYAYEEQFRHVVDKAVREKGLTETDGGRLQVKKGTKITVILSSPDVEIVDNEESQVWAGQYAKFDFPVFVPEGFWKSQILFQAAVYFDGVIATRIRFLASCKAASPQQLSVERRDVHSAFISYASADRDKVALILQGMRRSRPDMQVFFDVEALRSGEDWKTVLEREIETRDVLFLCWSKAAKASQWVEFEWRHAYNHKGEEGIEPIPLEHPENCPPPEELKNKHFNARELYYIQG